VVGGLDSEKFISTPIPSVDVFRRPKVALTVVVEGGAATATLGDSNSVGSSELLGAFSLSASAGEKVALSRSLELVASAAAHRAALDAQSMASLSVSASASEAHADTACAGHAAVFGTAGAAGAEHRCLNFRPNVSPVQDVRGEDADLLGRLEGLVPGSSLVMEGEGGGLKFLGGSVEVDMSEEGRAFLEELDMLAALVPQFLATEVCGDTDTAGTFVTPVSVVSTVSTLESLSRARGWDTATTSGVSAAAAEAVVRGWRKACGQGHSGTDDEVLAMVVSGVQTVAEESEEATTQAATAATARRLLSEVDAPTLKANATTYTMHEIATYQIKLGSGLMLAFALLMSVCLFCGSTMQYTDDNLLFGRLAFKQDDKQM
jgi:hypothetical protein